MKKYDTNAVKSSVNLSDIAGKYTKLTKKGNEFWGCCPFHGERTPSFSVNDDEGLFNCFGCGEGGDVISFIEKVERCSFIEAIQKIAGDDFTVDEAAMEKMQDEKNARKERDDAARSRVIVECARVWEDMKPAEDHPYLDRKCVMPHMTRIDGKMLVVPVYDRDGNIQAIQRIAAKKNDEGKDKFFPKGSTMKGGRLNFGICIGRTIVCEGFATGASIYEAVPDRVAVGFSKMGVIDLVRELHGNGRHVVIASDRNALPEMLALGKELGVPVYAPPDPYDDFNDMSVDMYDDEKPDDVVFAAVRAIFDGSPINAADLDTEPLGAASTANDDSAPVDLWDQSKAPDLPRGLLPPIIELAATKSGELSGADPGGYAMGMLCACAAMISDNIKIKVKRNENWHEEARMWVALMGEPSYKKSPIMKACTRTVERLDGDMIRQYNRDFLDWKEHENGEPPIPHRLRVDDITMESAQNVAKSNDEGLMAVADELSGWFGSMEKYSGGKGSAKDRSFWLRAFGGGQYVVDRVTRGTVLIENLSINILGGIQPDAIRKVMSDATDDGLIQRFFVVVLKPSTLGREDIENDAIVEYNSLLERLRDIKPPENFFGVQPLTFDDKAQELRRELEAKHHGMVRAMESTNKKMASHLGKYDGMFPRLCVVWHVIENANAETLPSVVTYETANRVARFLHEYIMRHSIAFYMGTIGLSEDQDVIEDVAGYILAHKVETVTMRTFQRGSTKMRKLTRHQVEPICHQLEAMGWIDSLDARGSRLTAKINPDVHERYADRAKSETDRREAVKQEIKKMVGR